MIEGSCQQVITSSMRSDISYIAIAMHGWFGGITVCTRSLSKSADVIQKLFIYFTQTHETASAESSSQLTH